MKELCLEEVDVPTYDFEVQKIVEVSSNGVMFRVHCTSNHGVGSFYYCAAQGYF